jgi:5-methylcytosine-specific restriction endonuclease McrA
MEAANNEFASLSNEVLASRITELAGHLNAANHRWLALVAEFDRREGWSDGLTQSCAHWLSWRCGLDMGAAREKVRVARALTRLPSVSLAMSEGRLSYSKVRALTRVATPETEGVLLNVALHGTAHHMELLVRKYRRVLEVEELSREERQQARRGLSYQYDEDGAVLVTLRMPAETGTLFLKAIDAAMSELQDVSAETSPSPSARRADAAGILAESFLAHGPDALKGGERQQIIVHVDAATLRGHSTGCCEFEDGPSIPIEAARRLSCDASKVEITEDESGDPLDVGRRTRTIPPAMRRALQARDKGCVFPGCTHKRYVDGHHVQHWADGGATKLSNLVLLCRFHHRAVHEGGLRIERCDDGAWRVFRPTGHLIDAPAPGNGLPLTHWMATPTANAARGVVVDERTGATNWRGEKFDCSIAVDAMLFRRRQAGAFTAPGSP